MLSCVFGVFVLMAGLRGLPPTLPIACVWELPQSKAGPVDNAALSIVGTVAVIAGNCIVFALGVWYIHSQSHRWTKIVQATGLLVLLAIGAGATVRVILLAQAFGNPSVPLQDGGEKDWNFGQLLSLLLLLLPLVSAVELVRGTYMRLLWRARKRGYTDIRELGEMNVPSPVSEERVPLVITHPHLQGREVFQPNPFWNSQPISKG